MSDNREKPIPDPLTYLLVGIDKDGMQVPGTREAVSCERCFALVTRDNKRRHMAWHRGRSVR